MRYYTEKKHFLGEQKKKVEEVRQFYQQKESVDQFRRFMNHLVVKKEKIQ